MACRAAIPMCAEMLGGAGLPKNQYRIVKDTTGTCGFPAITAPKDGTNVILDWFDLDEAYSGVTIQSILDNNNTALGGVMFNAMGASVNTCTTVSFPVRVTIADDSGNTRTVVRANRMLTVELNVLEYG